MLIGAEIRSEAVRLSIELGVVGFCGSEGWLGRFRRRYGVRGFSSNSSQSSHQRRARHPHPRLGTSLQRSRGLHTALRHPQARARRRAALVTRLLDSWRPRDIFAVDATSVYYALKPGQRVASQRKKKRRRSNKNPAAPANAAVNPTGGGATSVPATHRPAGPPQPPNHGSQHLRLHDDDPEEDPSHRADCLYTANGHGDIDRGDIGIGGASAGGVGSQFNNHHHQQQQQQQQQADEVNGQPEEEENAKLTPEEEAKLTVENRLTFVMCANMDASEKLPLLVIGLSTAVVNVVVHWYNGDFIDPNSMACKLLDNY